MAALKYKYTTNKANTNTQIKPTRVICVYLYLRPWIGPKFANERASGEGVAALIDRCVAQFGTVKFKISSVPF